MTVRHGYSADYSTDFRTNTSAASGDTLSTFELGSQLIAYKAQDIQIGNIRVNERFSPLVGLQIGWKGRLQTDFAWSKSNSYSLSTSNFEVGENRTSELTFSASYQRTGMKLPFFKRLDNRVTLNLTLSRSQTVDQRFSLRRALIDAALDPFNYDPALALRDENVTPVTEFTRTSVSPRIAYQFSQTVQADFTLQYERFESEDSRQPSATTINGTFNIRVQISN
jgi:cell surface protein SprA